METNQSNGTSRDPISLAKQELSRRCRENPGYSLRAFARDSKISHTVLSLVFSGKRKFSKKAIKSLADFMELGPKERLGLRAGLGGAENEGFEASEYQQLSLDSFQLVSEWYHYAILSALELPSAKFEAKWIAKTLGISELQAKFAMECLQRLGLVGEKNGRFVQVQKQIKIDNTHSTIATKKFHKQLLDKARESIERDSIEIRDITSMTLAMNPENLEYARERIKRFRRQLCKELESFGNPTVVYNFTMQLCPATNLNSTTNVKKKIKKEKLL